MEILYDVYINYNDDFYHIIRGAQSSIGGSAYPLGSEHYTPQDILMDEVACRGNEASVLECRHVATHDCTMGEMASVVCLPNEGI